MYRDPARLRRHRVPINLTREEDALLNALADFSGGEKSVLARTLLLERLREVVDEFGMAQPGEKVQSAG